MTPYSKIYTSFKKKIEDADLPNFTPEEQEEILEGYLSSSISYIFLKGISIVHDLENRDDENKCFLDDLLVPEIELVAMFMVVAWYEPKINSLENTLLMVTPSGEKWTNQKEHMTALKTARDFWENKAIGYYSTYKAKYNSYLGNERTN